MNGEAVGQPARAGATLISEKRERERERITIGEHCLKVTLKEPFNTLAVTDSDTVSTHKNNTLSRLSLFSLIIDSTSSS